MFKVMISPTRREFLQRTGLAAAALGVPALNLSAQDAGDRPARVEGVTVLNPRARVPVALIIDDSTVLVNLNRFAMPQFAESWPETKVYQRNWRDWPLEIPDSFVRKFGEWCAGAGVKGKYSIVPYPACTGRIDRILPGWTAKELKESLDLVRTVMMPNWDIHPEMVTHTRVIDLKTGHPYPDTSARFMENWEWTTGKSADEIGAYLAYALTILKNAGLPCEGVTTPGGFGNRALPQLAQGTLQAVRSVFGAEIPHYFRHLYDRGNNSVAPRVEYASGLDTNDPRCVVSIIGCAGDWTGGWDNSEPGGADKFITADGSAGRMVEVIQRGEPALMLAHWTGIHFNGEETGFKIFQEVVKRLHARFDHLVWMKLSEVSRYWAAKELTRIERGAGTVRFTAPFACPQFTVRFSAPGNGQPQLRTGGTMTALQNVTNPLHLAGTKWTREKDNMTVCFDLPKGQSTIEIKG